MRKKYVDVIVTKKWITDALLELMESQPIDKIRITDIISKAGVPRSTFYRYYYNKEDVLIQYQNDLAEAFAKEIKENDTDIIKLTFKMIYENQKYYSILVKTKQFSILLDFLNRITIQDQSQKEVNIFFRGGIYNLIYQWILNNYSTPIEQLVITTKQVCNMNLFMENIEQFKKEHTKL